METHPETPSSSPPPPTAPPPNPNPPPPAADPPAPPLSEPEPDLGRGPMASTEGELGSSFSRLALDPVAATSQGTTSRKIIKLISKDRKEFDVEEDLAKMSKAMSWTIEMDQEDIIPLPSISSHILAKVIDYCDKHLHPAPGEDLDAWDAEFIKVDYETLFDLVLAANDLNIAGLLDLACETLDSIIKGKTPDEICETFNITNPFKDY